MISSMTGFGRCVVNSQWGDFSWNLRSLNHRSLDINIQVPESFRALEAQCRRSIAESFERGRIDASLSFAHANPNFRAESLDVSLVRHLLEFNEEIQQQFPDATALSVAEILRWPGMISSGEDEDEELSKRIIGALNEALTDLSGDRRREGALVVEIVLEKLALFKDSCTQARKLIPQAQKSMQDRFSEKLAELDLEVDPGRWEQEIALALIKLDVAEEIDRIELHVAEFERVLAEDSVVGKKLSFLIQELVRETNTLGSKTSHYALSSLSVEMKVTLEQMREQIQNIE